MSPRRHNPYFTNPPLATRAGSRSSRQPVLTISPMSNSLCAYNTIDEYKLHIGVSIKDRFLVHGKIKIPE